MYKVEPSSLNRKLKLYRHSINYQQKSVNKKTKLLFISLLINNTSLLYFTLPFLLKGTIMKNKLALILFTFFSIHLSLFNLFAMQQEEPLKIIGYYPNWAIYRNPKFYPKDINPNLVTHINYAFIKTDANGNLTLFDSWATQITAQIGIVKNPIGAIFGN